MAIRFQNLAILIIFFVTFNVTTLQDYSISKLSPDEMRSVLDGNTESKWALGLKINLKDADLASIESLSGINQEMAEEMLKNKEVFSSCQDFIKVKGIGQSKAKDLCLFISLN